MARVINSICIHCAATPEGKDFTVEDIDRWHRQRGFRCIGYHKLIYRNGTVHQGRKDNESGAHCPQGGMNAHSIGICYIGGVAKDGKTPKDTRTPEQRFALFKLVMELQEMYGIPTSKVYGHCEWSSKACPSFDMNTFRKELEVFKSKRK